jgi:cation:H+ antiporter
MSDSLVLLLGVACAAVGGELFVRGVVGIARWARVSAGIIGATFAAFATSSPELSVAVTSGLAGTPQIALGDALGSNVVNLGLILGLVLLLSPLQVARDSLQRDFPAALLAPLLLWWAGSDGLVSQAEGGLQLVVFVAWLGIVVRDVRRQRGQGSVIAEDLRHGQAIAFSLIGLVFLVASGRFIVQGASAIAVAQGIDPFIIGATLVAIGTSAPELATALVAKLRGHDEVGVGTLLGSNIFNGLFIVGVAAVIHPVPVTGAEVKLGLVLGLIATLAVFPGRGGRLRRGRGLVLLSLYGFYLFSILSV